MNITKVIRHKKRRVLPFINVEVRGRLNFVIALIPAIPLFLIIQFFETWIAVSISIVFYFLIIIYLSEVDENSNSTLYRQYVKFRYRSGLYAFCDLNESKYSMIKKRKVSANFINYQKFRKVNDDI